MPKLGRRSEITELDYQTSMALTTRDAPFGTENTPTLKEKIIGGRYVSVMERQPGQNVPRYEKLSLVSDKPNHVDPRALTEFNRRHNKPYQESSSYPSSPEQMANRGSHQYEDPFSRSRVVGRPTNMISKRPDSKDISSRYPTLPPIDENRLKNHQISTVFEPEAWTRQFRTEQDPPPGFRRSFNSSDSYQAGRGSLYDSSQSEPTRSAERMYHEAFRGRGQNTPLSKSAFVKKLTGMLPKNVFLPDHPMVLSEHDETQLLQVLGEELRNVSPLKLRDIYLDIANSSDKKLSGYCQYQDLYYSMSRQMVSLPGDLLQATAAMFVSPDRPNRDVNYEKFLSFLGMAVKQNQPNGGFDQRPKSPVEHQVDVYFSDSEQAKLVSTVEQQLKENEYVIDFNKLNTELAMADRTNRGIHNLRTIMDVCYQLNIPLQSSVLNRVLQRCRLNSYDDRYSWKTFVEFLHKAQPSRVRSEPARIKRSPSPPPPQRHISPQRDRPSSPQWRRHEEPRQMNGYGDYNDDQGGRAEVISRLDQDIRQLERNYEDMRDKMRPRNEAPWFKSFMEFANALYDQDRRHDGDLPAEDVYKWTKMYNETGNLGIADHVISKALSDASKSGKVHIHTFLTRLGNVANTEKIV